MTCDRCGSSHADFDYSITIENFRTDLRLKDSLGSLACLCYPCLKELLILAIVYTQGSIKPERDRTYVDE